MLHLGFMRVTMSVWHSDRGSIARHKLCVKLCVKGIFKPTIYLFQLLLICIIQVVDSSLQPPLFPIKFCFHSFHLIASRAGVGSQHPLEPQPDQNCSQSAHHCDGPALKVGADLPFWLELGDVEPVGLLLVSCSRLTSSGLRGDISTA